LANLKKLASEFTLKMTSILVCEENASRFKFHLYQAGCRVSLVRKILPERGHPFPLEPQQNPLAVICHVP
jgi:hypothetical protein